MRNPTAPFKAGDYLSAGDAWQDAVHRLEAFDDGTKVVAKNAVIELIELQNGTITCHQVAVIARAIANALEGNTYGEVL
ncbi:hypothetical protein H7I87_00855 [Mycobacterium timonense]|uniref:Uncharacterized protein n=1 Tax=Mycobacterium bouchedurhonense TaxID=701041 RepID=A0AAW5SE88_MYCBC|nr:MULTISPECIES: hypothetical protein [Mycobacterium avium complex (MAC)]MCV6992827.1 hypothetical protein [Mycobacterium bouchedurhonense]MCV6993310.1 hypothetical protein [Mycobacterium timonense]ORA44489.1 hypothetical protein BST19_21345 [Mycobacterium bouchedurhonense]